MKPFENVYRRCRPLLGTFVEISLSGASAEDCAAWLEEAFRQVERVSALMSFHDPASELSRFNRTPVGRWACLSPPLAQVLELALELQHRSRGVFNVAVGKPLECWKLLPGSVARVDWRHLSQPGFELRGLRARRLLPVHLDLGGIAKGYAVDCAVETMRAHSRSVSGCVNAGGDLRIFGAQEQRVWIRSGNAYRPLVQFLVLSNQSLATSSVIRDDLHSPYVDIRRRSPLLRPRTAVVRADRCMIADALTKIALLLPRRKAAERIAASYGAEVSVLP